MDKSTTVAPEQATERVLQTLAAYAYEYGPDAGGHYLRSALVAAILADTHQVEPAKAVEMARYEPYDPRVEAASREADRLISVQEKAALVAEYGGAA